MHDQPRFSFNVGPFAKDSVAFWRESASWWRSLALHLARQGDDEGCAECLVEMRRSEAQAAQFARVVASLAASAA